MGREPGRAKGIEGGPCLEVASVIGCCSWVADNGIEHTKTACLLLVVFEFLRLKCQARLFNVLDIFFPSYAKPPVLLC
jgi:hypothetical protein